MNREDGQKDVHVLFSGILKLNALILDSSEY